MRAISFFLLLSIFILTSCDKKITFSGNTFLTLRGTITDTLNKPIADLHISLFAAFDKQIAPAGTFITPKQSNPVQVSFTTTRQDGSFQFTFPLSNGHLYISFPDNYHVADSVKVADSIKENMNNYPAMRDSVMLTQARIEFSQFSNYLYNIDTIKVIKP